LPDTQRFRDFDAAACASVAFLRERLGADLCMTSGTDKDGGRELRAEGRAGEVAPGNTSRWSDSECMHRVDGLGPRVAPPADEVAEHAAAPSPRKVRFEACVGVPPTRASDAPSGTPCAGHTDSTKTSLADDQPMVELISRLLNSLLETELCAASERRRAERAETEALTDALTGLYNRRGWDLLAETEEARCARYGHPACVLSIDLDGLKEVNDRRGHAAGDQLLKRAAHAIGMSLREHDVAARTGGDEFLVLGIECGGVDAQTLRHRVDDALKLAGVPASVGMARRNPELGLAAATQEADALMYARKAAGRHYDINEGGLTLAA